MPKDDAFASMIAALEAHGLSRADIATRAGLSRATVWRLVNEPRQISFETAARLDRLHVKVCGESGLAKVFSAARR